MSESLKLVEDNIDPVEDDEDEVKGLGNLVDELVEKCDGLQEEIEQVRLALGMSKIDWVMFREGGFVLPKNYQNTDKIAQLTRERERADGDLSAQIDEVKRLKDHVSQRTRDLAAITGRLERYLGQ